MSITVKLAKWITNYDNQNSIGAKLRAKRIAPLLAMIEETYNEYGYVSIIDIGGTETYWKIVPVQFLDKNNVTITIANLPKNAMMPKDYGHYKFLEADGCDLSCFDDNTFHIAHSNSVVEHVGGWDRMIQFSKELSRVGQKYFVQTPNFWFPVEPHCMTPFFHWFPRPIRIWLVLHLRLGYWSRANSIDEAVRTVDSARLLNRAMFQWLFKDACVSTEKLLWLPKSFIGVKK